MKLIQNNYEYAIVVLSLIGVIVTLFTFNLNYLSFHSALQLVIFFIFITMYSLQLKITIYYIFVFPIYFLLLGNYIFAVILAFIIYRSIPRWQINTSLFNSNKVNIYHANYEITQRYAVLFLVFVGLNLVSYLIQSNFDFAAVINLPILLNVFINTALLMTIYTAVYPIVEALYFYFISIFCTIALIVYYYILSGANGFLVLQLVPYLIMILIIYIYSLMHKRGQ